MPYKRGQTWVAQVRKDAKRKQACFKTKKEALAWEHEMKSKTPEDWSGRTDTICLGDWANLYLDFAKRNFSSKTYKEKCSMFKRFFKEVQNTLPIDQLTRAMVLDYCGKQAESRSGYAANKDRKNLVAAWNWGVKYHDFPQPNPCLVERCPEIRTVRYVPSENDFWKVVGKAEGQDEVMLLAFLNTAARRGELFRLRWEDVDFDNRRIRLFTKKRKGGSEEADWLPMTDELHDILLEHRKKSTSQWVFPNPESGEAYKARRAWMKGLCKVAGVRAFGIHAIRHLTASILANEGVPAILIQAILRHKNLSTTERYLHKVQDLRPALSVIAGKKAFLRAF